MELFSALLVIQAVKLALAQLKQTAFHVGQMILELYPIIHVFVRADISFKIIQIFVVDAMTIVKNATDLILIIVWNVIVLSIEAIIQFQRRVIV
jgi:hypothetical protein